jgi:hypothetical protein
MEKVHKPSDSECYTPSLESFKVYSFRLKRTLRRISGPKADELTKGWGRLHKYELHNSFSSPNFINNNNNNSVALVRELTIPTERSSIIGEVSVIFCG